MTKKIKLLRESCRKEAVLIENFKNELFYMVDKIDDYPFLLDGFNKLAKEYLENFSPAIIDTELEAEFSNQTENMKKSLQELEVKKKEIQLRQSTEISRARSYNFDMIKQINDLKKSIDEEKDKKKKIKGDQVYQWIQASAVAEKNLKFLQNFEYENKGEYLNYLQNLLSDKRRSLSIVERVDQSKLPRIRLLITQPTSGTTSYSLILLKVKAHSHN